MTDKLTGLRYIGSRYARGCAPEDLGVTYFTSSKVVAPLFSADPCRFEKQIIVQGSADYVIAVEKNLLDLYDAVTSPGFYNRAKGRAIHPEDIRAGAMKEHAKRSNEMKIDIVKKMHAKTTSEQRANAARIGYAKLTPDQQREKMERMRSRKTPEGQARALEAMKNSLTKEHLSAAGRVGGKVGGVLGSKNTNSQRWRCCECGLVTLPGPLGKHMSRSNHVGKERVV